MSNKRIKRQADELLGSGFSHQQAFDQLRLQFPEQRSERLARWLADIPPVDARRRYAATQALLLGCIGLNGLLRLYHVWDPGAIAHGFSFGWVGLVPLATLGVAYGIFRWQRGVFQLVGWGNLIGGLGLLGQLARTGHGGGDPWRIIFDALALAIGLLSLYLLRRAFASYKLVKQPRGVPNGVVFTTPLPDTMYRG